MEDADEALAAKVILEEGILAEEMDLNVTKEENGILLSSVLDVLMFTHQLKEQAAQGFINKKRAKQKDFNRTKVASFITVKKTLSVPFD